MEWLTPVCHEMGWASKASTQNSTSVKEAKAIKDTLASQREILWYVRIY